MTDLFQRFTVSTGDLIDVPAALPDALVGLDDATLLNLDVIVPPPPPFEGQGFKRVIMPPATPTEFYINKYTFQARFSEAELIAFNRARRKVSTLTDADYAADPQSPQGVLVLFEAFLTTYDALTDINLLDPTMPVALQLFVALGIITADRIPAILSLAA